MTFQAPKTIPGLAQESDRALHKALVAIQQDLGKALEPPLDITDVKTADYTAQFGELVLALPPAAGMRVLLPAATPTNKSGRVQIAVLSVASGGSVIAQVVGDIQTINDTATMTMASAGLTDLVANGSSGWSATAAGGGGGLTPIADESFLANVSGAPAIPVATLLSSLAGVGLAWNPATNALDAAGGGTDPRIFAWWGV